MDIQMVPQDPLLLEASMVDAPTRSELMCIVDHLEIIGNSPTLWKNISLELEEISNKTKSDKYWQTVFETAANKVAQKNKMLQNLLRTKSEKDLPELTDLDIRILEVWEKLNKHSIILSTTVTNEFDPTVCRICLIHYNDKMTYIFNDSFEELYKLSYCNFISNLNENDGFPQYICNGCKTLLDHAYRFKKLCKKSEESLTNKLRKQEHIESVHTIETNFHFKDSKQVDNVSLKVANKNLRYNGDHNDKDRDKRIMDALDITNRPIKAKRQTNYKCEICGILCKSSLQLTMHNMESHKVKFKPEPPYCTVCNKKFRSEVELTIHMRTHTGERPYICETCGKGFKTTSAVNAHLVTHANVKDFKCAHCPYRTSTKYSLQIHDRSHSGIQPYSCKHCSLKFSTISNMHKHMRNLHEKLKDHKCSQCERKFFTKNSARKHLVTHTGFKAYACSYCTVSYAWYNGLRKHSKKQHPGLKIPTEKSFSNVCSTSIKAGI